MVPSFGLTHLTTTRATKIQCRGRRVGEKTQEELGTITGCMVGWERVFFLNDKNELPKPPVFRRANKIVCQHPQAANKELEDQLRESREEAWVIIGMESEKCKLHRELVACLPSWELTYPI